MVQYMARLRSSYNSFSILVGYGPQKYLFKQHTDVDIDFSLPLKTKKNNIIFCQEIIIGSTCGKFCDLYDIIYILLPI